MQYPTFDFRQWYQTDLDTMEQVEKLLFNKQPDGELFYRGMANYEFVCISTFYRYFISSRELIWSDVDVGFNSMVSLPNIDMEEYKSLSFKILDDFYGNLLNLGSKKVPFETVAYLAQHYGLPTDLIDFSYDPKVALYFACCEMEGDDCSVYMFDIYARVKEMMNIYESGRVGFLRNPDRTIMNATEREMHAKNMCTTLERNGLSTVTPIINFDDIKYAQRILNQKGAFIYHRDSVPMDQLMYTASTHTNYQGRRVYKIASSLKADILRKLDEEYGINKQFIYPNVELNLNIIETAIQKTKVKFEL